MCWIVRSVVRVSRSSSSAVTSTRNLGGPVEHEPLRLDLEARRRRPCRSRRSAATGAGSDVRIVVRGCVTGVIADDPDVRQVDGAAVVDREGDRRDLAVVEERIVVAARESEAPEDREVRPVDRAPRTDRSRAVRCRSRPRRPRPRRVRVVASVLEAGVEKRELVRLADDDLAHVAARRRRRRGTRRSSVAFGTAVQLRLMDRSCPSSVTTGAWVGPPRSRCSIGAGVAQWISWRSNAARMAVMCGVPSVRLPLSSSAARTGSGNRRSPSSRRRPRTCTSCPPAARRGRCRRAAISCAVCVS